MKQKSIKVLLSIKPEFAEKIFDGTKKFEYRRTIFKNTNIKHIVVYASSPIQKVIGEFEIGNILYEEKNNLWQQTKEYAGITEDYFLHYFSDRQNGYAIVIKKSQKYCIPLSLKDNFNISPPNLLHIYYINLDSTCIHIIARLLRRD